MPQTCSPGAIDGSAALPRNRSGFVGIVAFVRAPERL
jgi:hypothetical protein